MLKKDELMLLKNTELSSMCKERGIPVYEGKNHVKKEIMVDRLLAYQESNKPVEDNTTVKKAQPKPVKKASEKVIISHSHTVNPVIPPVMTKELKDAIKNNERETEEILNTPWVMGNKDELIEKAEVGTLIAFIDNKGKPRTAKMVNRSSKRRQIKLVTEYDWEFIVSYDSVLWVKFGARWPKAVYTMLKEFKNGKHIRVQKAESEDKQINI